MNMVIILNNLKLLNAIITTTYEVGTIFVISMGSGRINIS